MTRYVLIAALAAVIGLGGWVYIQRGQIDVLKERNASLTRSVKALEERAEQSALARDVEKARAERWAQRSVVLNATIESILKGEVPDENLDPRIADFINGLRPD